MKDKTTALILSILLGGIGVDRFYLGYTGMGRKCQVFNAKKVEIFL